MHLTAVLVALLAGPLDLARLEIHKTDATHYTVTTELIDTLLAEAPRLPLRAAPLARGTRIVGVKLLDIKPDSVGAQLGFRHGDLVTAVNDLPLGSAAEVLSAYARTKDENVLTFSVTRAGQPVSIVWQVFSAARKAELLSLIKRVDDTHFTIKQHALAGLSLGAVVRSARIVPDVQDGGTAGFRLFGIRPTSMLHALGLVNGDRVTEVNGVSMRSLDDLLEAEAEVRRAGVARLSIQRRDQPVTIEVKAE
jgi:type II secretory pathway component PulC